MSVNMEEMITKFITSWTILIFLVEGYSHHIAVNLGGNYVRVVWELMDV